MLVEIRGVELLEGLEMFGNVRFFLACGCIPENECPQIAPHVFHFFGLRFMRCFFYELYHNTIAVR